MNLHGIVSGAIATVNPFVDAVVKRSTGYTTNPDYSRTPTYADMPIKAQVQAMSADDLRQMDDLNIQGIHRKIFTNGVVAGAIRIGSKGGDLVTFAPSTLPEGNVWLCTHVLEQWPDWCSIAITLQNDGA